MATLTAIDLSEDRARRLVERSRGPVSDLLLEAEPLRGGLESAAVARVTARFRERSGRRQALRWVVKRVSGGCERELAIHRHLATGGAGFAPDLMAVDPSTGGGHLLHLEWVRPFRAWPWRDLEVTREVTRRLPGIHAALDRHLGSAEVPPWDYETELEHSARSTVRALERLAADDGLRAVRRALPAARRVAEAMPRIRRELLGWDGRGESWIHGDLHPSNVLVRTRDRQPVPILLDWGRARQGSPLEDLSSWTLSLALWEPRARRRHDRLLRDYLEVSGASTPLGPTFRDAYWLAGACNAMAGALRYQLVAVARAPSQRHRRDALAAAGSWARALRRADSRWRTAA